MKISSLKLANSVTCGQGQNDFLTDAHYDMTLVDSIVIKIQHKRTEDVTYTTLLNTCWWKPAAASSDDTKSKQAPRRRAAGVAEPLPAALAGTVVL